MLIDGVPLTKQPAIGWSVSGGGSINSSGLFTAGTAVGGPFTVTATNLNVKGTALVVVGTTTSLPPSVAKAASASPNPVTGKTTNLSVLGADAAGEAGLIYTWATTGTPPGPM